MKTLIANADAALYQAKSEVRGSLRFFEAKLGSRLRERRELQTDLQSALDRGDLLLHYQPQKTIAFGKVIGFEALARWECAKRGMVPPDTFIPIAEQSSFIITLGERILREACKEAASWPNPLKVSVNISPIQFHHGDLPSLVHSILLDTGLKPERLELEITEGVLDRRLFPRGFDPAQAQDARHPHCARRFRIGIFLAVLPARLPVRENQDRSRLSSATSSTTIIPWRSFAPSSRSDTA